MVSMKSSDLKKICLAVTRTETGSLTLKSQINFFFIEHLDFMNTVKTQEGDFEQFNQVEHDYIGYQSLTDVPLASVISERSEDMNVRRYI